MITEFVFNTLKNIVLFFINLLPDFSFSFPGEFFSWFSSIVTNVAYFLPVRDMIIIFSTWFAFKTLIINYRLIEKVFKSIFR